MPAAKVNAEQVDVVAQYLPFTRTSSLGPIRGLEGGSFRRQKYLPAQQCASRKETGGRAGAREGGPVTVFMVKGTGEQLRCSHRKQAVMLILHQTAHAARRRS